MALQISLSTTRFGVPALSAYARIASSAYMRVREQDCGTKHLVKVQVLVYATAPTEETQPIDEHIVYAPAEDVDPSQGFLDGCYAWLKTLPEFADAVDV